MKRIDVICNDGSPLGVSEASIYGKDGRTGTGGAELFLLTLCRAWHDAGHRVRLYNSPSLPNGSAFQQLGIDEFNPQEERDVVIVFRSPNHRLTPKTKGLKIWLSCDQQTIGDFKGFASKVDKIVTISPNHADFFAEAYGLDDTITIDIPVRDWEYDLKVEKTPYRCIFNSVPDRGVEPLHHAWGIIVREVPEATLVITSDWRLWNPLMGDNVIKKYRHLYATSKNVLYRGAINRTNLIRQQLKAQLHLYPATYDELFCISVAENQVAGAYPITSDSGALKTTNMGKIILGDVGSLEWTKKFTRTAIEMLLNQDALAKTAKALQYKAKKRFGLKRILEEWEGVFDD